VDQYGQQDSPEDADSFADSVEILLTEKQFAWLTKQCEFLHISKQQLVGDAMEEWLCRYQMRVLPGDVSATIRFALDEFMGRHGEEFL
jgi:hypothetical protein